MKSWHKTKSLARTGYFATHYAASLALLRWYGGQRSEGHLTLPSWRRYFASIEAMIDADSYDLEHAHYIDPHPGTLPNFESIKSYYGDFKAFIERQKKQDIVVQSPNAALPQYYQRAFHFQPNGWLSDQSAVQYEFSVEVLFLGLARVMRRRGLGTAALAALDDSSLRASLAGLGEQRFADEAVFRGALAQALSPELLAQSESALLSLAIQIDAVTVLAAIMLFVASFALSLGPVMWVLFSELFPLPVRALAAATAGLVNSLVSFLVQLLFPWALAALGPSQTFGLFGAFALLGLFWVGRAVPETRGRPLEAMEGTLTRSP